MNHLYQIPYKDGYGFSEGDSDRREPMTGLEPVTPSLPWKCSTS